MKKNLNIVLLTLGGLILRLLGVLNIRLIAGSDLIRDWNLVGRIITTGNFPVLGPAASVNGYFHLGPFYYYLLLIPRLISSDYRVAIIFFSLISSISIPIFYKVCLHWFSQRSSLMIAAFYAFSDYFIIVGNSPWNPYIMPSLIIIALYSLIKIQEGKMVFLHVLFVIFGLMMQAHATALFIIPVFLLLLPLKKINIINFIISVLLFLFVFFPWISFNLECGFCEVREGLKIFATPGYEQNCVFIDWLKNHGNGESCFSVIRNILFIFRFFSYTYFYSMDFLLVLFMIIMTVFVLLKVKIQPFLKKMIYIWLIVPTVFFLFYSSNVYIHYFLIYFPLSFFIFALFLEIIRKKGEMGELIANVIFYLVIGWNVVQYLLSLRVLRG